MYIYVYMARHASGDDNIRRKRTDNDNATDNLINKQQQFTKQMF